MSHSLAISHAQFMKSYRKPRFITRAAPNQMNFNQFCLVQHGTTLINPTWHLVRLSRTISQRPLDLFDPVWLMKPNLSRGSVRRSVTYNTGLTLKHFILGSRSEAFPLLRRHKAYLFLKPKKKNTVHNLFAKNYKRFDVDSRDISGMGNNINEECCREGCFYEEIREYPCH